MQRLDDQERHGMSSLWDLVVIFTILCSLGFPGKYDRLLGSMLTTIVQYLPFLLQIIIMLFSSGQDVEDIRIIDLKKRYIPVYVVLVSFFVVSMMSTSFPKEQMISCIRFSVTAFFALWMVEHYSVKRIMEMTCLAQAAMVIFTIGVLFVLPRNAFSVENGERSFTGLFTTKNPCGTELAFGLMIQLVLIRLLVEDRERIPWYFPILLVTQSFLLIFTKATGAVFCALVPLFYLFFIEKRSPLFRRMPWGILYVVVSVGFIVMALTILPVFKPLFDMIGKDVTLTNRTPLWRQLVKVMTEHNTFTGFGFSMFWKDHSANVLFHMGFKRDSWGATMNYGAHNAILELWLDVGLIGLVAYFLMIVLAMRRPSELKEDQYVFSSACILFFMIKGLTERMYIPFNYQTLFLFLCVGTAFKRAQDKRRTYGVRMTMRENQLTHR